MSEQICCDGHVCRANDREERLTIQTPVIRTEEAGSYVRGLYLEEMHWCDPNPKFSTNPEDLQDVRLDVQFL